MAPKKKKAPKKKLQFLDDDDAKREARLKANQEKLEKERLQREIEQELRQVKLAKKTRDKIAMEEEMFRNQVLRRHYYSFRTLDEENITFQLEKRKEKEWEEYINCNHRPLGNDPPALNTFLYHWKLLEDSININNILEEVETMLNTIKPTEAYLADPLDTKDSRILNLTEAKFNYYKEIRNMIDKVTFDAIMDISKYHERVGFLEVEIFKNSKNFQYWLWGWCVGGRAISPLKQERPSRTAGTLQITLPGLLREKRYHMRVFYTSYDPLSALSKSYRCPMPDDKLSLYDELVKIRKMEVKALRDFYKGDYDEDVMPWWFIIDPEIVKERIAKEEEAKKMQAKKKRRLNVEKSTPDSTEDILENQKVETDEKKAKNIETKQLMDKEGTEEKKSDESSSQKSRRVPILYSRSMTDLLEEREKEEGNGPRYYSEDEPITYLDWHGKPPSSEGSTIEDGDLLRAEKHTTFRACFFMECPEPEPAYLFKDINKNLYDTYRPDPICFANNRVFLDWKNSNEESLYRELAREQIEMAMFGDSDAVLKDGKITYLKRKPKLRSIKELFQSLSPQASVVDSEVKLNVEELVRIMKPPTKVSNAIEMRELESEIANILLNVWREYSNDYISKLILSCDPSSLNLRQHVILGGVYYIDFFEEEPQPFVNKCDFKMQLHYGEYKLKEVIFDQLPETRIDLNIEMKRRVTIAKQKISERRASRWSLADSTEPELPENDNDLIWIEMAVQKNTVFIDKPTPVRWDKQNKYWTTKGTYGAKWTQNNETFHFKLGKSGAFALSINRFSHLPYDDFHIKPSPNWKQDPSVMIKIKARHFPISFLVKEDSVSIVEIEYVGASALSHIIGVPFKVYELIDVMRKSGLDLFPDWDSFLYVDNSPRKVRALEEHMYYSLGCSLPAFEYTASKANAQVSEDRIIVQVRECVECSGSQTDYRTMIIETYRIIPTTVQPTEGMNEHNDEGGYSYYPDLLSFLETVASKKSKQRMRRASKNTIATVISLIMAMKILSYS